MGPRSKSSSQQVAELSRDVARAVLLSLFAGVLLTTAVLAPNAVQIVKFLPQPWRKSPPAKLRRAVRRLKARGMVTWKESSDGRTTITLTEKGKKRALTYRLQELTVSSMKRWDGKWRMVIFDIPNTKKVGRDTFRRKLRELGMFPLQESVFVFPYSCKNEIDFLAEVTEVFPFVRYGVLAHLDDDRELRKFFELDS